MAVNEKKWYIVEQGSPEGTSFFLIHATKIELSFLNKVLEWAENEARQVFTENYRNYKGVHYD